MTVSDQFKNILIIKPGAIGDLLQMTPVIRALRKKFPSAGISILVGSDSTAQLFKHNTSVRETIVFDKHGGAGRLRPLAKLWLFLYKKDFDLVLNFQRSNLKTWFLASAALPCRILIYKKSRTRDVHAVKNYLETLKPLGIETDDLALELALDAEDRAFAERILGGLQQSGHPVIAINPGASHPVNRWSTDRFAELIDRLTAHLKATVLIVGGPDDRGLAAEIAARTASSPLDMTGRTTLLQLASLLERCSLLVSGDTGPMHIATAVGTKVVSLFGAADPGRTGPIGSRHRVIQAESVPCVPCRSRQCVNKAYLECMERITVSQVFAAISDMIGI